MKRVLNFSTILSRMVFHVCTIDVSPSPPSLFKGQRDGFAEGWFSRAQQQDRELEREFPGNNNFNIRFIIVFTPNGARHCCLPWVELKLSFCSGGIFQFVSNCDESVLRCRIVTLVLPFSLPRLFFSLSLLPSLLLFLSCVFWILLIRSPYQKKYIGQQLTWTINRLNDKFELSVLSAFLFCKANAERDKISFNYYFINVSRRA